jgi:hypothetical protein
MRHGRNKYSQWFEQLGFMSESVVSVTFGMVCREKLYLSCFPTSNYLRM